MNEKAIIALEGAIILVLLVMVVHGSGAPHGNAIAAPSNSVRLISPGVYAGTLQPQSHLLFNFKPLHDQMKHYIDSRDLNISVYIMNQRDGSSTGINEEAPFEPASLNKLPIAILILKKIEEGELTFDTVLPITPQDRDSRSGTLYEENVDSLSVRSLLAKMISESDNTAFHVLSNQVTLKELESLSTYLDYYKDNIGYTYDSLNNNTYLVSPESTSHLFLSLYLSTILQPKDDEYLLSLLVNTTFDIHKVASLPDNLVVAQKYGSYFVGNKRSFHDCGLMYMTETRIFYCIMTRDLEKEPSEEAIGDLVHMTYIYVNDTITQLSKGNM
ncbi:class A beta-lactamase-related serine hydrolase [Candidatus Pacearchaeota archaeon]|nr:class A beta-lactamase-related serine hydrolase [Candidatus Pacearchaeota archaeon]